MAFSKQDLLQLIETDSNEQVSFLQSLIRAPTPNPPGDTRSAIEVVQGYLSNAGISSSIIAPKETSPNLVSVFQAEGQEIDGKTELHPRSIVLNGHIDQFPVEDGSRWQRKPYSGDSDGHYVHGRSGVDMKAGTAASIIAFKYLHRLRDHLSGRCTLEVVSDEETGGRWGTRYLLEDDAREDWRGDCVLIGEPGGLNSIRFGEKGTLRVTFDVTAEGGHGAYLHRSEGAIRIASRLIAVLVELEDLDLEMDPVIKKYMQQPNVRRVADEIMSPGAADSMSKVTVNIGTIRGGVKINMIPSQCSFEADIRIPIGVETATVRGHVDEILKDFPNVSYTINENHSHPATHSEPFSEVVKLIQQNAKTVRGAEPIPISSLGATDCKHFRRHGIPAYAYGPKPKGMAEMDEKVGIEEFLDTVKVHTMTAWDYLWGAQ